MFPVVYETAQWLPNNKPFIYSHALNRKLNPEEHSHDFFELIYLFTGSATHRVNSVELPMEAGQMIVLRPGDTHLFTQQSEDAFELFSISIVPSELLRFLCAYHLEREMVHGDAPVVFQMSKEQSRAVFRQFKRVAQVPDQGEQDTLLRIILGMTMQDYALQSLEKERDWFQNILIRMKEPENMAEGVSAMMRVANLSHAQLCRTMKKLALHPPKIYIKELRLSTAYELIQNTSLSFEDIALRVGYASLSHFSAAFKARYGISPGALRKNTATSLL